MGWWEVFRFGERGGLEGFKFEGRVRVGEVLRGGCCRLDLPRLRGNSRVGVIATYYVERKIVKIKAPDSLPLSSSSQGSTYV